MRILNNFQPIFKYILKEKKNKFKAILKYPLTEAKPSNAILKLIF